MTNNNDTKDESLRDILYNPIAYLAVGIIGAVIGGCSVEKIYKAPLEVMVQCLEEKKMDLDFSDPDHDGKYDMTFSIKGKKYTLDNSVEPPVFKPYLPEENVERK